jgi:hypothetical protein
MSGILYQSPAPSLRHGCEVTGNKYAAVIRVPITGSPEIIGEDEEG